MRSRNSWDAEEWGSCLRALDPKLNRIVAIKLLAPELAAQVSSRRRFLREAQAAAAVSHPHVVTIHAVEEDQSYLVMECIVGRSLQQKIDQTGSLKLKEILRIGTQIAEGLAAAHKQGLVHRDIKPANILLENGIERVKITDFGLARSVDDVKLTRTGEVSGTPQYMSPEQALGSVSTTAAISSAWVACLYAMCTGRPPFRGDNVAVVVKRICDDAPRPIDELNPEIPTWLNDTINRLLAKNPDQRFQTAAEVAEILSSQLAHAQHPQVGRVPAPAGVQPVVSEARAAVASLAAMVPIRERPAAVWLVLAGLAVGGYLASRVFTVSHLGGLLLLAAAGVVPYLYFTQARGRPAPPRLSGNTD